MDELNDRMPEITDLLKSGVDLDLANVITHMMYTGDISRETCKVIFERFIKAKSKEKSIPEWAFEYE